MSSLMRYKGYYGSTQFSPEDKVFHGKLEYIRSLVLFEATDAASLEQAFEEAVDDCLETCADLGIEAEKPFKGSFNVRTGSEVHRRAALFARNHGKSLNEVVTDALKEYISEQP